MADRIERFQQRIGVNTPDAFRVVLPEIQGPGNTFGSLAQSLLRNAQPHVERDIEREAIAAAGVADIVKDDQGNWIRPVMPKGAGLKYAEVYDRAMDARYSELIVKDTERAFDQLSATHRNDPQQFAAAAQGLIQGTLKATDPSVRGAVEIALTREFSERVRGVTQLKAANDWQATTNGLLATVKQRTEAATKILTLGGKDAEERARVEVAEAIGAIGRLREMGEYSPEGVDAATRAILGDVADANNIRVSYETLQSIGLIMQGMDDDELARMQLFSVGTTDGGTITVGRTPDGKPIEADLAEWQRRFPVREIGRVAGSVAGNALSARVAARNEQAAQERAEEQQRTSEAMLAEIRAGRYDGATGYSRDQVAAIETEVEKGGPIMDQMRSQGGQTRLLSTIGTYGYMPIGVKDYIDAQVMGGQVHAISDFVQQMKYLTAQDSWRGQQLYEQLAPATRATIEYDEVLRRAGMPPQNRQALLEARRRGQMPKIEEVQAAFPRQRGQTYAEVKRAAVAKVLGVSEQHATSLAMPMRDFDELMLHNFQLYEGDQAKAIAATAKSVAAGWGKSSVFVGGVGPRDLISAGFDVDDLDRGTGVMMLRQNPTRATFRAGTAKLRPVSDNPSQGFGHYVVEFRTPSGRPAGSVYIDMDKAMRGIVAAKRDRRQQTLDQAAERRRRQQTQQPIGGRLMIPMP